MSQNESRIRQVTRRDALKALGAAAAVGVVGWSPLAIARGADVNDARGRKRALRLAHVTDVHVQRERGADEGLAKCLRHIRELKDPPDLILGGGDGVMDAFATPAQAARVQAD